MDYRCSTCGQVHSGLPDIGASEPYPLLAIPREEWATRVQSTSDTCVIDNEHYFIRGVIDIPLKGTSNRFGFGVWVSQKKENFEQYLANPGSVEIGPYFGWLSTAISYYAEATYLLKTRAHFRGEGVRPYIELEPTEHPLAVDQREGITIEKAWEIVHFYNVT